MLRDRYRSVAVWFQELKSRVGWATARLARQNSQHSLVHRLLAVLFLTALFVYFTVNIGLWWTSSRLIEENLLKQAGRWITELDAVGTPLYASRAGYQHIRVNERIRNFPEISFVRYYDVSGRRVLGEYGKTAGLKLTAPASLDLASLAPNAGGERPYLIVRDSSGGGTLRLIAPVYVRAIRSDGMLNFSLRKAQAEEIKVVGYIDLGIDLGYYREALLRSIAQGSLIIAAIFLLALFVGYRLIRRALAPLTNLQAPLLQLAQGDTSVRVTLSGDNEIRAIGHALNTTIAAIHQRDEALRHLADHDPLTGLANRSTFMREMEREHALMAEGGHSSAVLYIDLDQFKYVNDSYGHAAGDRLLIKVAEVLRSRIRDTDMVARFGGDEFVILARHVDQKKVMEMAASMNALMSKISLVEGDQTFTINCSIGITLMTSNRFTIEEVISQADMACYEAKSRGRNRFHAYEFGTEDRKKIMSDMGWAQQIKTALREDRFQLVFQPIQCMSPKNCDFYEVLLRLQGADGQLIAPGAFLPIAQRFGLLVDVDRWVISNAFKRLGEIRRAGWEIVFSINLSGQMLDDPDLYEVVRAGMLANQLSAGSVVFEITEQTAVRQIDKASQLISQLSELGCLFALDDFGKGFSSFSHLKDLPVHFIKIDGSFVENMLTNPVDQAMVESIIHIARVLGKKTIAEFVQNQETIATLERAGVDYVQGFHVGRPTELPAMKKKRATS
ncbi:MAG: EAL domain-containing protein [Pseudomonadota bacterium]